MKLRSISFNHDFDNPAALNVRHDAFRELALPEWRFPTTPRPEDSVAVYAVAASQGGPINIVADFQRTLSDLSTMQIRAIDPKIPDVGSAAALRTMRQAVGNVLGEVAPSTVTFRSNGTTGPMLLSLSDSWISSAAVGVHDVRWRWQCRSTTSTKWVDVAQSDHRIYTILDVPTLPWVQRPFVASNTQIPWIEVIDHACRWASGATTKVDAARRVTEAVFDLGPELLEYGCPIQGAPQYSYPFFYCTEFVELLSGGIGRGRYVNCSDCATIVSTFSNILGCDLWQSTMSGSLPFVLNPTVAIGTNEWRTACGWPSFVFHEVAWTGQAGLHDHVFDACVLVDADQGPSSPPRTPLLPVNLEFGRVNEGLYRDRLAAPNGRANCRPQPSTRQRRPVV